MMMGMPQQVVGGSLPATPRTMQQVPPQEPAQAQAQVAYQNNNHRKRPHPSSALEEETTEEPVEEVTEEPTPEPAPEAPIEDESTEG